MSKGCTIALVDGTRHILPSISFDAVMATIHRAGPGSMITFDRITIRRDAITWVRETN